MNKIDWSYYDKKEFEEVNDKYLPSRGEGDTMASQIVTVVNKLVYKWYNDGDVFDNTYYLDGWWNDLSSYANWLYKNVPETKNILNLIEDITNDDEYEELLKSLADMTLNEKFLLKYNIEKEGTIYDCEGKFKFIYVDEDEYEDEDEEY